MRLVSPSADGIAQAAERIRAGDVIAYPTETVYGLAVDPFNISALESLFVAKERPSGNPVLLVVSSVQQLEEVARISSRAKAYIDRFWPGPLSLVLPRACKVPHALCSADDKVCVRIPASEIARALCGAVGHAITSTSANRSGASAARSPDGINLDGVSFCIDGGTLPPSPPSTVFDPDTGTIIREGAISAEQLNGVTPDSIEPHDL